MEALGVVASIVQLVTIAASIIKTIHRIHDEAKKGLPRAFQRITELESLLAILHFIRASQPLTPDTLQVLLLIVHKHLHELDNLLAKVRNRSRIQVYLRLWNVPSIIKTESKIIEGLNNLERAKNNLILYLSATQGRTLEEILEKMNKQQVQVQYGYTKTVTNQRRSNFSSGSSPFAGERAFPTDEATDTLDYTRDHRQQGHMMAIQTKDTSPAAHLQGASQHKHQPNIDDPNGEESLKVTSYDNSDHGFVFTGSNNLIEPPKGSVECQVGSNFNGYPSTREMPMWKWTGDGNKIFANKIGNNINFANQPSSSSTSTQSTSASGYTKPHGRRTRSQK